MSTLRRILIGLAILSAALFSIAVVWVASLFFLPGEAVCLRDGVLAGTSSHTKIQLNIGPVSTSLLRFVLERTPAVSDPDARLAIRAVRSAAVGVYDVSSSKIPAIDTQGIDAVMTRRGWQRMLLVREHGQVVVGYLPKDATFGSDLPFCLAVRDHHQVVIVMARLDARRLADIAAAHLPPLKSADTADRKPDQPKAEKAQAPKA